MTLGILTGVSTGGGTGDSVGLKGVEMVMSL